MCLSVCVRWSVCSPAKRAGYTSKIWRAPRWDETWTDPLGKRTYGAPKLMQQVIKTTECIDNQWRFIVFVNRFKGRPGFRICSTNAASWKCTLSPYIRGKHMDGNVSICKCFPYYQAICSCCRKHWLDTRGKLWSCYYTTHQSKGSGTPNQGLEIVYPSLLKACSVQISILGPKWCKPALQTLAYCFFGGYLFFLGTLQGNTE